MSKSLGLVLAIVIASCGGDDGPGGGGGADAGRRDSGTTDSGGSCTDDTSCDDGVYCNGSERCSASGCVAGEPPSCDDMMACTEDSCDESARACVNEPADRDGDEHPDAACGGDDCDDTNARRYLGAMEICDPDDVDEDCDPSTYGFRDADMDGYGDAACCNGDLCGDDCADMASGVHPGLPEACDDRDNDCDGMTDEDVLMTFYRDADADGYAADGAMVESVTACFAPMGFVTTRGDCDDAAAGVNPAAYDSCDSARIDENCDGVPNNPPTGCVCVTGDVRTCMRPGRCASGREMCMSGTWGACSVMPIAEVCNGEDDDCNGTVDDGLRITCYADADRDGYAPSGAATSLACTCPAGTTSRAPMGAEVDCDDSTPSRSPAVTETCDGMDQNCNGMVDEGLPRVTLYRDVDGDGHYGTPTTACLGTPGTSASNTDCDDADRNTFPGQTMYFGEPRCRGSGGWYACFNGTSWACYDTASTMGCGLARGVPRPSPTWDYDCSGEPGQRIRDRDPVCNPAFSCSTTPGCFGESGFDYDTAAPPACGQRVSGAPGVLPHSWSCGCDPRRMCMTNTTTAYFPCR